MATVGRGQKYFFSQHAKLYCKNAVIFLSSSPMWGGASKWESRIVSLSM